MLGMFAVHTGAMAWEFRWLDPTSWTELAWGNSSATFAVLAGVAVAILSGRTRPLDGVPLVQARMRILVRAALIFVVGGVLVALGSGLVVIVEFYALYLAMTLPFLRVPWWALAATGIGWILVMPTVRLLLESLVWTHGTQSALVDFTITGFYPALTWFGYTLVGMAIGRLPLETWWARVGIIGAGVVLVATSNLAAAALAPIVPGVTTTLGPLLPSTDPGSLLVAEGHSGSAFDLASSAGIACIVIGVCVAAQRWLRWPLLPVAAIGSMSLTAYTIHVIAFLVIPDLGVDPWSWVQLSLAVAIACTLWRALLPKGPLEWAISWVSRRASEVRVRQ